MSTETRLQGRPHDRKALIEADRPELKLAASVDLGNAEAAAATLEYLAQRVRERAGKEAQLRRYAVTDREVPTTDD